MGEQESRHQLQKGKEVEMLACTAIDAAVHRRRRASSDALASGCTRGQAATAVVAVPRASSILPCLARGRPGKIRRR
jgi:hypothetical protein